MVPLWLGVVPFALAYAVTARGAGLSLVETQALSALVFAGSAQFTAVGLFAAGSAGASIVLTTLLLNIRHLLYGVSVGRQFDLSRRQRPVAAFFLTDEAFGVASGTGERAFPFLLGVELSLFVTWNLATFGGFLLGSAIPDPTELGVDLIFPLAFLALLVPMIRTRIELGVAVLLGTPGPRAPRGAPGRPPRAPHRHRRQPSRRVPDPQQPARTGEPPRRRGAGGRVTFWLTLAGMVAVTFGSRYAGLVRRTELPEFWVRFLHFVPIAVFASLVTPYLEGDLGEWGIRVTAAAVAALAAWRTRQLWLAITVGMAVFWLLRIPF